MILRRKSSVLVSRLRTRGLRGLGLGDTFLDAYGNPVTCGPGLEWDSGACVEDCSKYADGTAGGIASSAACVARNQAAWNAAAQQQGPPPQWWCNANPAVCIAQGGTPGGGSTSAPPPAAPPAVTYNPRLSFSTSRGGTTVQPGDTWQISITGAAPNSPVTVATIRPDGSGQPAGVSNMGTTNSSGAFSLAGSFDISMLGNWSETWSVAGAAVGSLSFAVVPAPSSSGAPQTVPAGSSSGSAPAPSGGGSPSNGSAGSSGGVSWSSFLSSPVFLAGAAGVGVLLLFGGGGRR